MNYLIVFIGAGIGGSARHAVNVAALRLLGADAFPFGTLSINVLGSFLIGVVAEYFALRSGLSSQWRLFLATGMIGGFTTFSAYSLEVAVLYERGNAIGAILYTISSVVLSIGALFLALAIVRFAVSGAQ